MRKYTFAGILHIAVNQCKCAHLLVSFDTFVTVFDFSIFKTLLALFYFMALFFSYFFTNIIIRF